MSFKYDLEELYQEEWETGGITIYCDCGNDAFVEPDGQGWCDHCKKEIKNPLIESGLI